MFSGQTFGGAHKSISMFLYSKILVLSVAPFSLYNLVQFNKLAASCLNVVHRHVLFSLLIIKKKKKKLTALENQVSQKSSISGCS